MITSKIKRFMRKHAPLVGALLVAPAAVLAIPGSASAALPPEFVPFEQCPKGHFTTDEFHAEAFDCVYSATFSGELKVGTLAVPINKPIILQGAIPNPFSGSAQLIPAKNGETLPLSWQVVPGGIFALVQPGRYPQYLRSFCKNFPSSRECRVEGTAELEGAAEVHLFNIIGAEGTAVFTPIRIHLRNPFLGSQCFVGSASKPIGLDLTTGTTSPPLPNTPISGSPGILSENADQNLLFDTGFQYVNNSFAAPAAEGCGGPQAIIVDKEINTKVGLPAAAGFHSTIVLHGNQQVATAAAVTIVEEENP